MLFISQQSRAADSVGNTREWIILTSMIASEIMVSGDPNLGYLAGRGGGDHNDIGFVDVSELFGSLLPHQIHLEHGVLSFDTFERL